MNRASSEVNGFSELIQRFERNISIQGKSPRTFDNYSRHVAALALHFGKIPTELDPEDIKDYLFELQQRSKTPSQTYFKHTVYGLRFLLKAEGLPYSFLHLPAIPKVKKLPTILSRQEVWRMLQTAQLLKHKLLIGLIYGCGLRCMEVGNIELHHLDFDRQMLHVVQGKGQKDRYIPLSEHLIRGLKTFISVENPTQYLFNGNQNRNIEEIDASTTLRDLSKPKPLLVTCLLDSKGNDSEELFEALMCRAMRHYLFQGFQGMRVINVSRNIRSTFRHGMVFHCT
ncbi:tyrosine-type recombinase/integrase [Kaistella sp.]|uniref:tyrosine-type recombinase/integrase n=4 Tax=Kaistella sp. TaxID=2782235 RepID=UPI0035A00211